MTNDKRLILDSPVNESVIRIMSALRLGPAISLHHNARERAIKSAPQGWLTAC